MVKRGRFHGCEGLVQKRDAPWVRSVGQGLWNPRGIGCILYLVLRDEESEGHRDKVSTFSGLLLKKDQKVYEVGLAC